MAACAVQTSTSRIVLGTIHTRGTFHLQFPLAYSQRCRRNVDVRSDDVFVRQWEGGGVVQTNWLLAAVALFPDAHWLRSGMLGSGLGCSSRAPFHFPGAFSLRYDIPGWNGGGMRPKGLAA